MDTGREEIQKRSRPDASASPGSLDSPVTGISAGAPPTTSTKNNELKTMTSPTRQGGDRWGTKDEPAVWYQSINVSAVDFNSGSSYPGSLRIESYDEGGPYDLSSINIDLIWQHRKGTSTESKESTVLSFRLSLDEILTLRVIEEDKSDAQVAMTRWGGEYLPTLAFPNGPDAAMSFIRALGKHLYFTKMSDSYRTGQIYSTEKKPRMRQVAPSIVDEEDLCQQAPQSTPMRRFRSRSGAAYNHNLRNSFENDVGMIILEQFAKVTHLVRNFGEDVSLIFDERRRRNRNRQERRARERAFDIPADTPSALPTRLVLDEPRGKAMNRIAWDRSFGPDGKLLDPAATKQAIFSGGLEPDVRPFAWPFLLNVYPWDSDASERTEILRKFKADYESKRVEWESFNERVEKLESSFSTEEIKSKERAERLPRKECKFLEIKDQIAKDIVRTDRHMPAFNGEESTLASTMSRILNLYAFHEPQIGYCQGMSDILSPIVYVMKTENEALAFWCFESLMKDVQENFREDQCGIRSQLGTLRRLMRKTDPELARFFELTDPDLYTCFRWMIVQFKREVPFENVGTLWEAFWCKHVGDGQLHLYMALALLRAHRKAILGLEVGAFDVLLRYVNDMAERIDIDFALKGAEQCYRELKQQGVVA